MFKKVSILIGIITLLTLIFSCDNGIGSANENYNLEVYETGSRSLLDENNRSISRSVVDYFKIGSLRMDVLDTLNNPDTIFYGPTNYTPVADHLNEDAYFIYNAIGLSFRIFGTSVREITLLNSDWMASNGLIVGMNRNQMLEILGNNYDLQHFAIKDIYEYSQYAISVEVGNSDNLIWEINIQEENVK